MEVEFLSNQERGSESYLTKQIVVHPKKGIVSLPCEEVWLDHPTVNPLGYFHLNSQFCLGC